MPRHFQGGKFTASHTTVIEPAERVLKIAEALDIVSKISIGMIRRIPSKVARLKFKEVPAGLMLTVIGKGSMQDVVIYTKDRENVQRALEAAYAT